MRGVKVLIESATLQIHPGWKVGLTGANGSGKSSLFAMLRDQLHPDQGDLDLPPGWVIAHVAQETPGLAQPAIDYVLDGDAELRRIEAELVAAEAAHDGSHIGELHARLHEIGGYAARARAASLLDGLGFGAQGLAVGLERLGAGALGRAGGGVLRLGVGGQDRGGEHGREQAGHEGAAAGDGRKLGADTDHAWRFPGSGFGVRFGWRVE